MDDTFFSLRLKHGVHTIFLFIDPRKPFSDMSSTLLEVLHERYSSGTLKRSTTDEDTTKIPSADDEPTIHYAKLKNAHDPTEGWDKLRIKASDTPSKLGIKDGSILAFSFEEDGFPVEFPQIPDEEYEE